MVSRLIVTCNNMLLNSKQSEPFFTPLTRGQSLPWQAQPPSTFDFSNIHGFIFRRTSMARLSFCWLSPPCRSAWSWSWDRLSSYAIRSRGWKWLSMRSMPTNPASSGRCLVLMMLCLWRFPGPIPWFPGLWEMAHSLRVSKKPEAQDLLDAPACLIVLRFWSTQKDHSSSSRDYSGSSEAELPRLLTCFLISEFHFSPI